MHMSSRILLVLAAATAIAVGWWILFAVNDGGMAVIFSVMWTIAVLVGARTLLAVGLGYNRLTAKGTTSPAIPSPEPASAPPNVREVPDRGVISHEVHGGPRPSEGRGDAL